MTFRIGEYKFEKPLFLAPMAGVTDKSFRLICKEMGADVLVSEMVSSKGIFHRDKKTNILMDSEPIESPFAIQIFGSCPETMAHIVKEVLNKRDDFDFLDINMGCPAPKIVKNGDGSALMKDLKLARQVIQAVVKNSNKPVSLKLRTGFSNDNLNGIELLKIAEEEGIAFATLHGRTREMLYSGQADWDYIRKAVEAVNIPIIGNGDIFEPQDAIEMFNYTKCAGVAIARGARGNPFIFRRIKRLLQGKEDQEVSYEERVSTGLRELTKTIDEKGEYVGLREMRRGLASYIKDMPGSSKIRDRVNKAESFEEVEDILLNYVEGLN